MTDDANREVLLWHDAIHETVDRSRLHFWRLSFSPSYERDGIFEKLRASFSEMAITSYAIYQTLGDYDLLLRMWVPQDVQPDEVALRLWQALRELKLWNINYLSCKTEFHWAKRETDPTDWPDRTDPVLADVNDFNRRQLEEEKAVARSERISELVEKGALLPVPIDTRGIRFFITFDHPRVPFNPTNRRVALRIVVNTCREVLDDWGSRDLDGVSGPTVSIYEGLGTMTEFLLMVRAPHTHFHKFVGDIALRLRQTELDGLFDMRPYTHVIADRMFSDFAEERPMIRTGRRRPAIDISDPEHTSLEFKATFGLNVRALIASGRSGFDDAVADSVVRSVCGMLNAPEGGTVVIGVLETRRELERVKDKVDYLTKLRELLGCDLLGEENEVPNDPPNVVIGIEAEVGPGRIFSDRDVFVQRLSDVLRQRITPNPWHFIEPLDFQEIDGKSVCAIYAPPAEVWFYARLKGANHEQFFVREGASTREYSGQDSDLYKQNHRRNNGAG